MNQQQITDPHVGTLLTLALERCQTIGHAGALAAPKVNEAAAILQGYIAKLHELANDPRLQGVPENGE